MDLLQCLKARAAAEPKRTAAVTDSGAVTISELLRETASWAKAFRRADVLRTVLFCENRVRFAAAMLGAWAAGVRTILPTDLTPYTQSKLREKGTNFVFDGSEGFEPTDADQADDADAAALSLPMQAELVELFTSGSTGEPARIVKKLDRVLDAIDQLDRDFETPFPNDAVIYSTVSHQHIYGYLWALLWPLSRGMTISEKRLMFPETIAAALGASRHAVLITSPAHLKRLPEMLDWSSARSSLLGLVSSGGPLSVDGLLLSHRIFHRTPFEILGSTELDGIAWRQRVPDADEPDGVDPASALWRPMPGTEVRADPDGVLAVRSSRLDPNLWIRGDDRIECSSDGRFSLLGRVDRIAKIEEKRVSLTALEAELAATGLLEAAKAAVLEPEHVLAVAAVPTLRGQDVLRTEGKLALVRALKAKLSQRFEKVVLPRRWRFEPMMPSDARGKCTVEAVGELFDARRFEPIEWHIGHDAAEIVFEAVPETPYFHGHFPSFAIMPGVAQLHTAILAAHRYLGTSTKIARVTNLKFTAMMRPGVRVRLKLAFSAENQTLAWSMTDADNSAVAYSAAKVFFRN